MKRRKSKEKIITLPIKYIVYSLNGKMYQHKFRDAVAKIGKNSFTVIGNFKYNQKQGFID